MAEGAQEPRWVRVADEAEIRLPVTRVECEGRGIVLFRLAEVYYALEDCCSHEKTAIAGGEIVGKSIRCPRHGARFDIRTGKNLSLPAVRPVASYPVRVEDGVVYIQCTS